MRMVIYSSFWMLSWLVSDEQAKNGVSSGSLIKSVVLQIVLKRLNWKWLLALSSLPSFVVLLFYGIVPESPRYISVKGRTNDVLHLLEKISQFNKTHLPDGIFVSDKTTPPDEQVLELRTTFLLWTLFFGNSFTYYGIILLTSKLSSMQTKCGSTAKLSKAVNDSSLYTDVFLASLGELPRLVLAAILVDRVGRKFSMMVLFILLLIFLIPLVMHQLKIVTTDISNFCKVNRSWSGNRCGKNRWYDMPSCSSCHQTAAVILFEIVIVVAAISVRFIPFKTKGQAFEGHSLCTSGQARLQGMNKN
ncbi:hypothetical protein Pint_13869 [Pistacia integerrima]|uniref:Uncharacterized protein n=1 Tax=Pistacia integerrima TaxID=434235 RepID=A0ACC0Y8C0_9ROSI|nr:hypothetical protein Pint_13869 [Pistacia integerrima]